jgi:hypothetical protein
MGGGTPSFKMGAAPAEPAPIDYGALMQAASAAAASQVKQQFKSMVEFYPQQERQQLATMQNLSTMLGDGGTLYQYQRVEPTKAEIAAAKKQGKTAQPTWERIEVGQAAANQYTADARSAVNQALGQRSAIDAAGGKLGTIGDWVTQRALESYDGSGPTSIESRLYADAERELGLGRALTPEQERAAAQSARASFSARGLGTSMGSAAAEILNRDSYATMRENERRQFAAASNNLLTQNVMARRDQAAQQAALGSQVLGQSAQVRNMGAGLGLSGAQALTGIDPVRASMGLGQQMGQGIQTNMGNIISPTYANATNLAGQVAGFNTNMASANYNSYLNSQAALRAASMSAGASQQAGMMGMIGGIGGGALAAGGSIGMGLAL